MRYALLGLGLLSCLGAHAADFLWTRMTGQYPVECAPLIHEQAQLLNMHENRLPDILAVNRLGQVMVWDTSGEAVGTGQDGTVATLPEGTWTSTPALLTNLGRFYGFVFVSTEGRVVALNYEFDTLWDMRLPGETQWARATPVVAKCGILIGDVSGNLTCLSTEGKVNWSTRLPGPCLAPPAVVAKADDIEAIFVAAGNTLSRIGTDGAILWSTALGEDSDKILTSPVHAALEGADLLLCVAGEGALCAVNFLGRLAWKTEIGTAVDDTIVVLEGPGTSGERIYCTGLWGNLYAFGEDGKHLWTSFFRSKTRGKPLIVQSALPERTGLLIPCYNQHAYLYGLDGKLLDDVRTNGTLAAGPVAAGNNTALLVSSSSLLAHRVQFNATRHPYENMRYTAATFDFESNKKFTCPEVKFDNGVPYIEISNEERRFERITVRAKPPSGPEQVQSVLTVCKERRFQFPGLGEGTKVSFSVEAPGGKEFLSGEGTIGQEQTPEDPGESARQIVAGLSSPFEAFDPAKALKMTTTVRNQRYARHLCEINYEVLGARLPNATTYYSQYDDAVYGHIETELECKGQSLVEGVYLQTATPATNGEQVYDALKPVGPGDEISIPPHSAIRVWLVPRTLDELCAAGVVRDGKDCKELAGYVRFVPKDDNVVAPDRVEILAIAMTREAPLARPELKYCTWDYIPNQWFPERAPEVIAGMKAHGVNVFPRTRSVPTASVSADGQMQMDYRVLDEDLSLLQGQTILFQVGHPSIQFPDGMPDDKRKALELEFFHLWRDHLKERGWEYDQYAFYINDEPGLDYGKSIPNYLEIAQLFREADPRFRIYVDPVHSLSWDDFQKLYPYIDVWCPNMRLVTGLLCGDPRMRAIMASGKPVWSYECVGQVKSLSPLLYNRARAWRAFYFGLSGIGTWTFSTTQRNHWEPGTAKDDEYALVYPGEYPVRSVRWEAEAEGIRDWAVLKQNETLLSTSNRRADWYESVCGPLLEVMERSDAAYVESRDYLKEGDRRIWEDEPGLAETYTLKLVSSSQYGVFYPSTNEMNFSPYCPF